MDALLQAQPVQRRVQRARFEGLERRDALLRQKLCGRGGDGFARRFRRRLGLRPCLRLHLGPQFRDLLLGGFELLLEFRFAGSFNGGDDLPHLSAHGAFPLVEQRRCPLKERSRGFDPGSHAGLHLLDAFAQRYHAFACL